MFFFCDPQKHSLHLFLSKFLFLSFSHGRWTQKEVLQHYSTSDRPFFGSLWAVSIEEKDTETGISCTSNPLTLHEFSVPGRLDWYAVWTRWIVLIHYELWRPFDQVHNSSSPEEQNCRGSGLSANRHLLYVWCPIHTAEWQWPWICKQNNTKLDWLCGQEWSSCMESQDILKVKDQLKDPTKIFETCSLLGCPTTTREPGLKDYGLSKASKPDLCIQASRQALTRLCSERRRGSDLGILHSLKMYVLFNRNWRTGTAL